MGGRSGRGSAAPPNRAALARHGSGAPRARGVSRMRHVVARAGARRVAAAGRLRSLGLACIEAASELESADGGRADLSRRGVALDPGPFLHEVGATAAAVHRPPTRGAAAGRSAPTATATVCAAPAMRYCGLPDRQTRPSSPAVPGPAQRRSHKPLGPSRFVGWAR